MKSACLSAFATVGAMARTDTFNGHFLVMGDWGGSGKTPYTTSSEVSTAKAMNDAAENLGAKFALALGDNFYTRGVSSLHDPRFIETFEQCFTGSSLQASNDFKFHVIAGNHDHIGDVSAQVHYSGNSSRWSFPSLWYTFTETTADGATVQFVMMDTPSFAGNSQINDEDTDSLTGWQLPGPWDANQAQSQLDFIKDTLSKSTADFLIVAGHYPIFSPAEHGPTKALQPDVFPFLRENKVSAYLCGHEHSENFIDVGDGIQYHIIGSAHLGDSSMNHAHTLQPGQLVFHNSQGGGFATVQVNKTSMQIKHFSGVGELLYTAPVILPRGAPSPPAPTPPAPTPPTPPSPSDWDCHENHKVSVGNDQDLEHTGDDISSCQARCLNEPTCKAVSWHKTDSHCHVYTGSFSHDEFLSTLESDSTRDSCFLTSSASTSSVLV